MIPEFQTTFAVPLTCQSCITSVSTSLHTLPGISSVRGDLTSQLLHITGTAAPSSIINAIQATGRDAILRGSGKPDSAAVCILETHTSKKDVGDKVRGLVRIVQVGEGHSIFDVAVRGVGEGRYVASLRAYGDIARGAESTGPVFEHKALPRGVLGTLEVGKSGLGSVFVDKPVAVWELIGRSIVVAREGKEGRWDREDADEVVGVVARSAGVWENEKTVCSCSGKTVWEERVEQRQKGVL